MGEKKLKMPDYDRDREARANLIDIIEEEARLLYPHEVTWYLAMSISQVYALVPKAKTLDKTTRFHPSVVKSLMARPMPIKNESRTSDKPSAAVKTRKVKREKVPLWRSKR